MLKALGTEDCKTADSSPQSNGMAENFVKTLKCDYLPFIDLTSATTALACLPEVIEQCNREHLHAALGYQSPHELRQNKGLISNVDSYEHEPICLIPGFIVQEERLCQTAYYERI